MSKEVIIAGQDCKGCKYLNINEVSKSKIIVECNYKEKKYYYGQCIPCDNK